MPFCSQCGNTVQDQDRYCPRCVSAQPQGATSAGTSWGQPGTARRDPLESITPRTAAILCYIPAVGWVAAVGVLATARFRNNLDLRFHAFQALYLFAVHLLVQWAIRPVFQNLPGPVFRVDSVLLAIITGVGIFMMVKASQNERYSLPFLGDLAERSAHES